MKKLSFKEYLASKVQLKEAIMKTPIHTVTYSMNKYCKLPLGETKDKKQYISLKPKNKVIVEWKYEDINAPEIIKIMFEDVENIEESTEFKTFWVSERFQRWLRKNTREVYS